jgi:lipopolysaccharide export system permease protein
MRTLHRYILAELLKVSLVTVTALTAMILLAGVAREASSRGLGPAQILRLIPYLFPDALRFSVPATLLFSVCSVYGRMSAANEVVAVKSLGISPMTLLWPGLIFAFLASLLAVWLNEVAVSWGTEGVRRVIVEEASEIAYGVLRTQKRYSTRQFSVVVKGVEGRRLISPVFTFFASDGSPPVTVRADEAEFTPDFHSDTFVIAFRNGAFDIGGKTSGWFPETFEYALPLEGASQTSRATDTPAMLPIQVVRQRIVEQQARIDDAEMDRAIDAAEQMLEGDFEGLTSAEWDLRNKRIQDQNTYLHRLQTEPYRRWANGFSCLCFVLVGAPYAIRMRSADVLSTFFACFMPILIIYYPLLVYGVDAAKSGRLPACAVWLGNVILVGCGLFWTRRVLRY